MLRPMPGRHLIKFAPCIVLLLITLVGCGEPTGALHGNVVFDGTPLPHGTVAVICDRDGAVRQAMIVDGAYRLEEVPLGHVRFTVAAHAPPRTVTPPDDDAGASPAPQDFTIPPVPDRYRHPDRSGLATEVTEGEQTYDLHLSRR